ncbi:MAG: glycosyltransferase, partial [Phycisphaerales bacterium]|nr:glycosyltransferase [Phycisphaerales bacterium]
CPTCTTTVEPTVERERRLDAFRPGPRTRPVFRSLVSELGRRVHGSPEAPGRPVTGSEDAAAPFPLDEDQRGTTASIRAELDPPRRAGPGHPDWAPIDNRIVPEAPCTETPYGRRRLAMIEMLNRCDRVLAVSRFVRDKFVSLGVREEVIDLDPIGTRMNRIARWHADVCFAPPSFREQPDRPIRLLFLGYNNWAKGLPMLADALELLTPEVLRRLHLAIYAYEGGVIEWRFRRMEPRLGGLEFGGGYQPYDIPWICGGRDLGLVPSVWWDNGPQTVLEFQACGLPVLGASIGGIPDVIRDGTDGALFRANDRYDLARHLAGLVRAPSILETWRSNVRPPRDITDHARDLADRYHRLASRDRVGCDP